jgi:hypothetical protein
MRKVRLTESQLHRVIKESVRKILKEAAPTFQKGDREKYKKINSWMDSLEHYFTDLEEKLGSRDTLHFAVKNGYTDEFYEADAYAESALQNMMLLKNKIMYMLQKRIPPVMMSIDIDSFAGSLKHSLDVISRDKNILSFVKVDNLIKRINELLDRILLYPKLLNSDYSISDEYGDLTVGSVYGVNGFSTANNKLL